MSDETYGKISAKDAIRRKHEINQSITWRGYNAKQISELEKFTDEDFRELKRRIDYIQKEWYFIPNYVWGIGAVLASIWMYSQITYSNSTMDSTVIAIFLFCIYKLSHWEGMKEGYWCGYESGHKDGIQKALEIPDEDLSDMSERATEMEIDEMIIKGMDERKGKS